MVLEKARPYKVVLDREPVVLTLTRYDDCAIECRLIQAFYLEYHLYHLYHLGNERVGNEGKAADWAGSMGTGEDAWH